MSLKTFKVENYRLKIKLQTISFILMIDCLIRLQISTSNGNNSKKDYNKEHKNSNSK